MGVRLLWLLLVGLLNAAQATQAAEDVCAELVDCTACALHESCAFCAAENRCMTASEAFARGCGGVVLDPGGYLNVTGIHLNACFFGQVLDIDLELTGSSAMRCSWLLTFLVISFVLVGYEQEMAIISSSTPRCCP